MDGSQPSYRLYVGNLLYQVQPEEIESVFEEHNILIKHLDMSIDPFTGRNPSYCFVDLHTALDATRALQVLPGVLVRDRPIKVRENTERRRKWCSYPNSKCPKPTSPYDPAPVFNRYEDRHKSREHWKAPVVEGRRLWISGLLHHDQRQVNLDMRALFHSFNILAVSKPIFPRPECADEAAEAAATLDKYPTPNGGAYKISIAGNHRERKVVREQKEIMKAIVARDLVKDWRARSRAVEGEEVLQEC